jgi:uncharacterized Tic20 family protein
MMTDPAQPSARETEMSAQEHEASSRAPQAPPWELADPPWGAGTPGAFLAAPTFMTEGTPVNGGPTNGGPANSGPANSGPAGSAGHADAATQAPGTSHEERWAMACYLGALFFWLLAPLAIYLAKRNSSIFIRSHAAQAFNLTLTATLFALSGGIVAGLLTLDSPAAALVIIGPVLLVFWIVVLTYLIRAVRSASRDDFSEIPGWLCVTALR